MLCFFTTYVLYTDQNNFFEKLIGIHYSSSIPASVILLPISKSYCPRASSACNNLLRRQQNEWLNNCIIHSGEHYIVLDLNTMPQAFIDMVCSESVHWNIPCRSDWHGPLQRIIKYAMLFHYTLYECLVYTATCMHRVVHIQ